jgi:hypothetical protein
MNWLFPAAEHSNVDTGSVNGFRGNLVDVIIP